MSWRYDYCGGDNMKRINIIKKQLCNTIESCRIGEFEFFTYELRNTKVFNMYIIEVLNSFENACYKKVSEKIINKEMKNGNYSIKLIGWLGEECDENNLE